MATQRIYSRSFAGGLVSRDMWGRVDDGKYQTGLAECLNFIVRPQGAAENRPGTTFVNFAKYDDRPCRVIPFVFNSTQVMALELGHNYIRFHAMGQTLMDGGVPYEIGAPWTSDMVMDIHYVQSADVVTLVHPGMAPRELRRLGALSWQLVIPSFATPMWAGSVNVSTYNADTSAITMSYQYAVTSIRASDGAESVVTEPAPVTNNLFVTGSTNTITVTSSDTTIRGFVVYKKSGGQYGYIGQLTSSAGGQLVDNNIAADMSRTPPLYDDTIQSAYPSAVGYYEQRKVFAGGDNTPQNVWMTRSGTENQMTYSIPVRDDDRVAFKIAAREVDAIRHLVPMNNLLALTSSAEWRISAGSADAVTPTNISAKPQSYVGASNVQPVVVNNTAIFCGARGGHLFELGYNWQAQGYATGDLSLRNADLFEYKAVKDLAYAKAPYPIVWAISSDGSLLGMTYIPEQQIGAWHRHTTQNGSFESICTMAEYAEQDMPYLVVKRTLGGMQRRCIERLLWRKVSAEVEGGQIQYSHFLDCGISSDYGYPSGVITGLNHLEGETVHILVDGIVEPPQVVSGGAVRVDRPVVVASVGLPIEARIRTLPVAIGGDASLGQGRVKNVNKVWLRVYRSSGIKAGQSLSDLHEYRQRTTEVYGAPPNLVSDEIEIPIDADWAQGGGQVYAVQDQPLPLTVLGITAEVVFGG